MKTVNLQIKKVQRIQKPRNWKKFRQSHRISSLIVHIALTWEVWLTNSHHRNLEQNQTDLLLILLNTYINQLSTENCKEAPCRSLELPTPFF